jgi:hypothetical protein
MAKHLDRNMLNGRETKQSHNQKGGITMAVAKRVTYFKTNVEDKPGALLTIAQDLKSKNLGLVALWGFATQPGQAEIQLIPKNPDKLRNAWKISGMMFEEGTGFFLKGADKTGALVNTLKMIAVAGVNIVAHHAVGVAGSYGAFIRVAPADVEKMAGVLKAK